MANSQLPHEQVRTLLEKFPGLEFSEGQVITAPKEQLLALMKELKGEVYGFNFLSNLTAVDHPDYFEVVFHLDNLQNGSLLTVKSKIENKEDPEIASLCPLWKGAEWQEREVFDLMGIVFSGYPGHPTRILLDDNFKGYPLRKDFEWEGGRE